MARGDLQFSAPRCFTRAAAPALWVEVMLVWVAELGELVAEMRSKRPRRRTAISVSSFKEATGSRIALLVFRRARPKMVRASCWDEGLLGAFLEEMARATEEVARAIGDSGEARW